MIMIEIVTKWYLSSAGQFLIASSLCDFVVKVILIEVSGNIPQYSSSGGRFP